MTNLNLSPSGSLFQQVLIEGDYSPHFFAYYYKQWNNYNMSYHQHNSTEIMYLISGSCIVDVRPSSGGEERVRLKRGELIILDANVPHRLIVEEGAPCRMLNVEFGFMEYRGVAPSVGKLAREETALAEMLQLPFSSLVMPDPEEIYHVLKGLVLELDQSGGKGEVWLIYYFVSFCCDYPDFGKSSFIPANSPRSFMCAGASNFCIRTMTRTFRLRTSQPQLICIPDIYIEFLRAIRVGHSAIT